MAKLDIVGLGLCTLDVLMRLRNMPTWEEGTRLQSFGLDGGGPVATAMVASAKLGARVGYVGTAGTDVAAEIKLRAMRETGIDLSRLKVIDGPERSVVAVFVHADTGERCFAGVEGIFRARLQPEDLDREYITSADFLHLDGLFPDAAIQAAKWMRAAGKKVVLDGHKTNGPVAEHMRTLVGLSNIVISGGGFVQSLTGKRDYWEAMAAALQLGPSIYVQTEGPEGCNTITATERFHTPIFKVDVVDTTGAGDVFHGAYIVGLLHGWSLPSVAQFSAAVSAIKCTKLGGRAGIPRFDEVISFLAERGIVPT
jgi:ribokinase